MTVKGYLLSLPKRVIRAALGPRRRDGAGGVGLDGLDGRVGQVGRYDLRI
jgi:hypothetical protein